MVLPLVAVFFFSGGGIGGFPLLIVLPVIGFALLTGFTTWYSVRYRVDDDELVFVRGILSRDVRRVPLSRIHNVAVTQNVLHRMLDVAVARIETAGGEGAEAELNVVAMSEVERLRGRIFARRAEPTGEDRSEEGAGANLDPSGSGRGAWDEAAAPPTELVGVPIQDLVIYGLTRNRSGKILAALFGLSWELTQFGDTGWRSLIRFWPFLDPAWFDLDAGSAGLGTGLSAWLAPARFAVAAGTMIVLLLLLNVVSVVWAVVQLYGFRLTRRYDDLRSSFGMLTRHTATIPRRRIQSVAVQRGWLYRRLGRASLSVETAGSDASSNAVAQRMWLSPVSADPTVAPLLEQAQPGMPDPSTIDWQPVSPRARRRITRRRLYVLPFVLAALAALPFVRGWALLAVPPYVALAWWEAGRRAAGLGWAVDEWGLWLRRGWWTHTMAVVRPAKLQNVSLIASPFDRRANMATLVVDTAGHHDPTHRLVLPYLPAAQAEALRDGLLRRAAQTTFRW